MRTAADYLSFFTVAFICQDIPRWLDDNLQFTYFSRPLKLFSMSLLLPGSAKLWL